MYPAWWHATFIKEWLPPNCFCQLRLLAEVVKAFSTNICEKDLKLFFFTSLFLHSSFQPLGWVIFREFAFQRHDILVPEMTGTKICILQVKRRASKFLQKGLCVWSSCLRFLCTRPAVNPKESEDYMLGEGLQRQPQLSEGLATHLSRSDSLFLIHPLLFSLFPLGVPEELCRYACTKEHLYMCADQRVTINVL